MSKYPIETIRHSLAHVMAYAVKEMYPDVKFGIGPVIENGFYYDFLSDHKFSEEDFINIEGRMIKAIEANMPIEHIYTPIDEAIKDFRVQGQLFKLEILEEIRSGERKAIDEADAQQHEDGRISFYKIGHFIDLCKGPHVESTGDLPKDGFKILSVAGAYWKGSEKNQQLQRIYAVAFENKDLLEEHIKMLEEAKKRDHKKLGPELDLFTFSDLVGSGLPLWTPKGTILRNILDEYVWELRKAKGYELVDIPHITKKDLYEKSGHWEKFQNELFKITTREGHLFAMKPMNCPHHVQIYDRKMWSYRDLPQRYASTTKCYRDEQSGELSGISRARSFTQDDAHVFCRVSQVEEEFLNIWDIVSKFYSAVGLNLKVSLSLSDPAHPEKYLGDRPAWEKAENILKEIVKSHDAEWFEGIGEAAFYGPKLDFMAKDALGREWQVATIQLDMNMPERFDLTCVNEEGGKERIVMIHAAIMGSIERFISVLIEHTAGDFPVWVAPIQIALLTISDKQNDFASDLRNKILEKGLRVELYTQKETLGKKIREAEMKKIPYIFVVGDKEMAANSVSVRSRKEGDMGVRPIEEILSIISTQTKERTI